MTPTKATNSSPILSTRKAKTKLLFQEVNNEKAIISPEIKENCDLSNIDYNFDDSWDGIVKINLNSTEFLLKK